MNSSETKLYDFIKIITTVLVVVGHATRMYAPDGAIPPLNGSSILEAVTYYIYLFHMPLFMLSSGAIYGYCIDHGKYNSNIAFLKNKSSRILIPYLFFGIIIVAPTMCILNITDQNFMSYIYNGIILSTNARHLWFLLALFWIFIIVMLLKPLLKASRIWRWVITILSFALPYLILRLLPETFQIYQAILYVGFFMLGICLHYEYDIFILISKKIRYIYFILPFILLAYFFINNSTITLTAFKFIGIAMVLGISLFATKYSDLYENKRWYQCLLHNSFGIYLFHPMIIYCLYYFFGGFNINPFIFCSLVIIIATILSLIFTESLRKLKLGILIGE